MNRIEAIEQAIYDVAVDHDMWIGDDGKPLDYLPEREARIGEFIREAAQAVLAADHCASCPFAACEGCRYQTPTEPAAATEETR